MLYPIPAEFDFEPFLGCELNSIVIGSHHVEMKLFRVPHIVDGRDRKGCAVIIEAGFILKNPPSVTVSCDNDTLRYGASHLVSLIDQSITAAKRLSGEGVEFEFSNGARLELLAPDDGFESFHLHTPEQFIDV